MALHISTGPHLRSKDNTQRLMLDVLIALCPATAASIYFFGYRAALIVAISTAAAVLSEFVWQKLAHKPLRIDDLSAAVTGVLLGLNMPANVGTTRDMPANAGTMRDMRRTIHRVMMAQLLHFHIWDTGDDEVSGQ